MLGRLWERLRPQRPRAVAGDSAVRLEEVERVATRDLGIGEAHGSHAASLRGLALALESGETLDGVAKARLRRSVGVLAVTSTRVLFCSGSTVEFEVPLGRIMSAETTAWPDYRLVLRYAGGPAEFDEVKPDRARSSVAQAARS